MNKNICITISNKKVVKKKSERDSSLEQPEDSKRILTKPALTREKDRIS